MVFHDARALRMVVMRVGGGRAGGIRIAAQMAAGGTADACLARRLSRICLHDRLRLSASARFFGERASRQSLSGALSPGSSLARHADLQRARVPAPAIG